MKEFTAIITKSEPASAAEVSVPMQLDEQSCERARLSRDVRFDGLFYTAVISTGIYCRPVCPAPAAKSENVRFFHSAAAAGAAGFRPCLRCRPELAPGADLHQRAHHLVRQAMQRIESGALDDKPVSDLAYSMQLSERHLRRLFKHELGVSPQQLAIQRRLLFAKQLLHDTHLRITDVALAAGFSSLRRFNDAFVRNYGLNPSMLRKQASTRARAESDGLCIYLPYREPYNFEAVLAFLRHRMIEGLEWSDGQVYQRVIPGQWLPQTQDNESLAWLEVRNRPEQRRLEVHLYGVDAAGLLPLVRQLRCYFDVDADSVLIDQHLASCGDLEPHVKKHPGIRLPGTLDGFELVLRAIIGQQVSVKAARTLLARVFQRCAGQYCVGGRVAVTKQNRLYRICPTPQQLLDASLDGLGLTKRRVHTLRAVAEALLEERVSLSPAQTHSGFIEQWCQLPGIGPWTAQYLAMRALHHPDAFPAGDLVLRRALPVRGEYLSEKALERLSHEWRPWRAYAAILLWHSQG